MGFFSFFKAAKPAPVDLQVSDAVAIEQPSPCQPKENHVRPQVRFNFKRTEEMNEVRDVLALVQSRICDVETKSDAVLYLCWKFAQHDAARLQVQNTLKLVPNETPRDKIVSYAAAIPQIPKVTLDGVPEVLRRIAVCRDVLEKAREMPYELCRKWRYALHANERLLILIYSGLGLECRLGQGVRLDTGHYYQPATGKAKMFGSKEWVLMDPQTFIAEVTRGTSQ